MLRDESAWVEFILSKLGLIIFSGFILICGFMFYPVLSEWNEREMLNNIAREIASKIEAVGGTTLENYRYNFTPGSKPPVMIEISTEYVVAYIEKDGRMIKSAHPLLMRVYPMKESELRKNLTDTCGENGTREDPIDFGCREDVHGMLEGKQKFYAGSPFKATHSDGKPKKLTIEKIYIYYEGDIPVEGYVLIYER
jgi:hypothetical protein